MPPCSLQALRGSVASLFVGNEGLTLVPVADATALFADARACPLGFSPQDLPTLLWQAFGFPATVLIPQQRHTDLVFTFSGRPPQPPQLSVVGVCDALMTAERGVALAVQTADCLPVVLAGGGVVGIVHAGWRGLAAGILGKAVRLLCAQFGLEPKALHAVIGVGVGPCHYPVGPEVVAALENRLGTLPQAIFDGRVNLQLCAQVALLQAGLVTAHMRLLPGCTACSPHHHSYRRDGPQAGRQWAAVVLPQA